MKKHLSRLILVAVMLVGVVVTASLGTAVADSPPDTSPPTEPGAITVSAVTSTGAYLSWSGSKDNVGIEGYRIWRGLNGGPMSIIYTNDALDYFQASDLRSNATYQFGVTAIDSANNQSPMQTTTLTTAVSTDTTVPAPPSNASLSVKAFSSTRLDVLWGNSPSTNVAYFEVFRNLTQIATVDLPNAPRYSDNGLSPATKYSYTVVAVSSAGLASAPTAAKTGTTTAVGVVNIARGPVLSNVTASAGIVSWWTNIPTSGTLSIAGQTLTDVSGVVRHHEVSVSGLTPATANPYSVTSVDRDTSQSASASGTMTTAALPGQTFSFTAMGDYGGGGPGEVENAANIGTAGTQFIQTLGDNIYPSAGLPDPDFSTTYSDFDSHWYKELGPDVKNQAFFPANGNKDYYSNGQFWVNFPMPGTNHEWYSYDWGDAHILVLDSEEPMGVGSDQYAFAQNDLATHQSEKWRIVAIQRPPYSSTTNNSSSKLAQVFIPMFQAYRVNLVLSGNSHNYERSYPLTNGVQDTAKGITYIVSGGGGSGFDKFTAAYPEPAWSAFRESDYFEFAKITVSPTTIQENAIRADTDAVFDTTTIGPLPADTSAPSPPTGLMVSGAAVGSIPLSWTPNPMADGVSGYDIYRNGTKIGSTSGTVTSFVDSTASAGATYQYTIDARDGAGNVSPQSAVASVTTPTATQATMVQTAGSSTTTVTLPAPSTQGDLLVLSASVFTGASKEITSVTDAGGNTWRRVGAYTVSGQNADGEMWYVANAAPVSSVTVATGATTVALRLQEFSGVVTTNPLDASSGAAATGTSASSGSATPTAAADLAVGFIAGHSNNQSIAVSSPGYLLQPLETATSPSKASVQTGYQLLSSTAARSFAGSFPAAMYWSDGLALFKTVAPPPPTDFGINLTPNSSSVTAGSSATASVSTTVASGSAESVALSATGAPAGALVSFSPQSVTSGGAPSTMTATSSATTPAGSYPITVTGTASSGAHSAVFTLIVKSVPIGTPRLVQTAGATETAAASSLTGSFPAPTTGGDLLVLSASVLTGATNQITSVTDSAGNTWLPLTNYYSPGHNSDGVMWYTTGPGSASTVTVHTKSAASIAFSAQEFSGVAAGPPDASTGAPDAVAVTATTSASSGAASSTQAGDLAIGFIAGHASKQAVTVTTPGFTTQAQQTSIGATSSTDVSVATGYQVLTAPTATSFDGSFTTAMFWAAGVALFKAAG